MPVFRASTVFEIARGVKCFLGLNAGVTRGQVPDFAPGNGDGNRVRELQQQLKSVREESSEKDKRIERLRKQSSVIQHVEHEGLALPPANLRPNAKQRKNDNQVYLDSTRKEVDWMIENLGLSRESSVLDLGCGPGRVAIGILDRLGEVKKYRGVDVNERYVRWAQHHIAFEHPSFQFHRLNLKNEHYNPEGEEIGAEVSFPFEDAEFDVIFLFSVFTHMMTEDVKLYLKELHRVLHPSGKVFLTANLADGVPDVTENPEGYRGRQKYIMRLETVLYNREFFERLLDASGFHLEGYDTTVKKGQSCLIVSKKPGREMAS